MAPPFAFDVAVMHITVAALMTTPWIARFLPAPPTAGTDLVLIPGLCEGDPAVIAERMGVRVAKGPKDLREIPEYFGQDRKSTRLNSSHPSISYAVFCLKKKNTQADPKLPVTLPPRTPTGAGVRAPRIPCDLTEYSDHSFVCTDSGCGCMHVLLWPGACH